MGPLQDRHLSALNNSDMSSKLDEGRDDGNCICVVSDDEGHHNPSLITPINSLKIDSLQ